jgi:hypothetical protein
LDTKNRFWYLARERPVFDLGLQRYNLFLRLQNLFTFRLNFAFSIRQNNPLLRLRAAKVSRFFTPPNPFSEKGQSVQTTRCQSVRKKLLIHSCHLLINHPRPGHP